MANNKPAKATEETLEQKETTVVEQSEATHSQEDYQKIILTMQAENEALKAENDALTAKVESLLSENQSLNSSIEQLEKIANTVDFAESEAEKENFAMKCEKKNITAIIIDGEWYGSEIASVRKKPIKQMTQEELYELWELGTVFKKLDTDGNFVEVDESPEN